MNRPNKFMVVDDNSTNNMICEFVIRKCEKASQISLFTEPEQALEIIKKQYVVNKKRQPTLLFLDINMPSMTGWEFLDEFSKFGNEIIQHFIIYILTSSVDERDKEKAEASPLVRGFFSKPLRVQDVQQVLDQLQD